MPACNSHHLLLFFRHLTSLVSQVSNSQSQSLVTGLRMNSSSFKLSTTGKYCSCLLMIQFTPCCIIGKGLIILICDACQYGYCVFDNQKASIVSCLISCYCKLSFKNAFGDSVIFLTVLKWSMTNWPMRKLRCSDTMSW